MNWHMTVSYTHLDVYKRQDYDKKEKELSGEAEVSEEKESLEEINGIAEPIQATNFRITDCLLYTSYKESRWKL